MKFKINYELFKKALYKNNRFQMGCQKNFCRMNLLQLIYYKSYSKSQETLPGLTGSNYKINVKTSSGNVQGEH